MYRIFSPSWSNATHDSLDVLHSITDVFRTSFDAVPTTFYRVISGVNSEEKDVPVAQ